MTKRTILSFGLLIIIAAGAFIFWHKRASAPAEPALIASSTPEMQDALRNEAWQTFTAYLAAAKNHDIAALGAVSYKLSDACTNPDTKNDCYSRMDTVYNFGKDVKITDLPNITGDDKQVMLSTNNNEHLDGDNPSITRGILYFARAADGSLKLASIQPFQGAFLFRDNLPKTASTTTISTTLKNMALDTDGDLLPDSIELCADEKTDPTCVKTDPNKKDTDGDGWWDSIEPYVK